MQGASALPGPSSTVHSHLTKPGPVLPISPRPSKAPLLAQIKFPYLKCSLGAGIVAQQVSGYLGCLGWRPDSSTSHPASCYSTWEAASDSVLWPLPPTRETGKDFRAPGFHLAQPRLLKTFGEQTSGWKFCHSAFPSRWGWESVV